MTLDGYMDKIACPALLAAGEYDPRSPLDHHLLHPSRKPE
jgi:hypothetical protein